MAGSSSDSDNNFWPGFVDAMTNVVIAMIFVVIVLALALSFSVQQIALRAAEKIGELENAKADLEARLVESQARESAAAPDASSTTPAPRLTQQIEANLDNRRVITSGGDEPAAPTKGASLGPVRSTLLIEYTGSAIQPDEAATARLGEALVAVKARLAELPDGAKVVVLARGADLAYSENQRLAYMRALAVRNLLLAQGIAAERIVTRIDTQATPGRSSVSLIVEGGR